MSILLDDAAIQQRKSVTVEPRVFNDALGRKAAVGVSIDAARPWQQPFPIAVRWGSSRSKLPQLFEATTSLLMTREPATDARSLVSLARRTGPDEAVVASRHAERRVVGDLIRSRFAPTRHAQLHALRLRRRLRVCVRRQHVV